MRKRKGSQRARRATSAEFVVLGNSLLFSFFLEEQGGRGELNGVVSLAAGRRVALTETPPLVVHVME